MISATIVIEHAPHGQRVASREITGGQLVIGRSTDADWQIDDPEMFLSRKHCTIAETDGVLTLTDCSRSGVFVDGASTPLGAGNAVTLEDGMRLRMGDFVFRVDMEHAVAPQAAPAQKSAHAGFRFAEADPAPPELDRRAADLPDPFDPFADTRTRGAGGPKAARDRPPLPLDSDNPFALDRSAMPSSVSERAPRKTTGNSYFDTAPLTTPATVDSDLRPATPSTVEPDLWSDPPIRPQPYAAHNATDPATTGLARERTPPQHLPEPHATPASDTAMRAAFFRGLGLDPARHSASDPLAEMEALGEQFRALVDGVMHLLRARAAQKQNVRVAQTLISSADVNPLKFLATTDDALAALVTPRGSGYLDPKPAIHTAFRDLADHQMRTFAGVQAALRRMIDGFDPETLEQELAKLGRLETLLGGGRSARLWQLYQDRYRDIATAAEERFLGEIGTQFREAYENEKET